jgi:hypothetical protein
MQLFLSFIFSFLTLDEIVQFSFQSFCLLKNSQPKRNLRKLMELYTYNNLEVIFLKRIILILGSLLALTCLIIFASLFYIKQHPPLQWNGHTIHSIDQNGVTLAIVNNGQKEISIDKVLYNDKPISTAKLAISNRSVILGAGIEQAPDITIHPYNTYSIYPKDSNALQIDGQVIQSYSVQVIDEDSPRSIEIEYHYFGVPLSLVVLLDESEE